MRRQARHRARQIWLVASSPYEIAADEGNFCGQAMIATLVSVIRPRATVAAAEQLSNHDSKT